LFRGILLQLSFLPPAAFAARPMRQFAKRRVRRIIFFLFHFNFDL